MGRYLIINVNNAANVQKMRNYASFPLKKYGKYNSLICS